MEAWTGISAEPQDWLQRSAREHFLKYGLSAMQTESVKGVGYQNLQGRFI